MLKGTLKFLVTSDLEDTDKYLTWFMRSLQSLLYLTLYHTGTLLIMPLFFSVLFFRPHPLSSSQTHCGLEAEYVYSMQ